MIVLGFDPGTASTGWGVIEQDGNRLRSLGHGCIVTSAKDPTHLRLRQIHDQARGLIKRFKPDIVVLEELFVNVNVKTALAVGQAKGVLILAACDLDEAPREYSPLQIKLAVTGYGRASKVQVQEMTKVILGLARIPQPDHAADALAVAITHTHHNGDALTTAVGKAGARRNTGAFKLPPGVEPVPAAVLRKASRSTRPPRDVGASQGSGAPQGDAL